MSPIFLFDMGVVVFVISPASRKVDGLLTIREMTLEVIVEELTAIVGIKAEESKGEPFFDIFDLLQNTAFPFPPDSSLFCPAGSNIGEINCIGKHS